MKNFNEQVNQQFRQMQKENSKTTIGNLSLKDVNPKEIEDFLQSNTDDMIGKQLFIHEKPEQIMEESKEYIDQGEYYT